MGKNECVICGQTNPDVLEQHLVAFCGEETENGQWSPPVYMTLCVNCHRVIHRCCWALISSASEVVLAKYMVLLQSLPGSLSRKLRDELIAARDSVTVQYQRAGVVAPTEETEERRCALCQSPNPDLLEEHVVISRGERAYLGPDIVINVCANCHRVILKFYDGKVLPSSVESKLLLHEYLNRYQEYLSSEVKEDLVRLCGLQTEGR